MVRELEYATAAKFHWGRLAKCLRRAAGIGAITAEGWLPEAVPGLSG